MFRRFAHKAAQKAAYEFERAVHWALKAVALKAGYELRPLEWSEEAAYAHFPAESLRMRRFYNVGAGDFSHPYWTNVDYISDSYASNTALILKGINYDLLSLDPLPIASGVAEAVYSSHTIEHVTDDAAQNFFNEAYRILKPGGFVRLTTPDIDLEYRAWKERDRAYFYWVNDYYHSSSPSEPSTSQVFLHHFASSASILHKDGDHERIGDEQLELIFSELPYEEALDFCVSKCPPEIHRKYPEWHRNWWNWDKFRRALTRAGFENPRLSGYGQSFCPPMRDLRLFDYNSPKTSIYVEAQK